MTATLGTWVTDWRHASPQERRRSWHESPRVSLKLPKQEFLYHFEVFLRGLNVRCHQCALKYPQHEITFVAPIPFLNDDIKFHIKSHKWSLRGRGWESIYESQHLVGRLQESQIWWEGGSSLQCCNSWEFEAMLRVTWNSVKYDETPLTWSQQVTTANP